MTNNHGRWRRAACAGPLAAALVLGVCLPAPGIGETTAVLTITVKTQGGLPPNRAYIHVEQADPAVEPLDWVWMNGKSPDEKTGIVTYTGLHLGWK
ncbi:MAG: hypothetical protein FWD59_10355, partial [Micrococcales bacterium]|nr:hypothetical protein [Micrococcales bacterium]